MDSFSKDGFPIKAIETQQSSQEQNPFVLLQAYPDQGYPFTAALQLLVAA